MTNNDMWVMLAPSLIVTVLLVALVPFLAKRIGKVPKVIYFGLGGVVVGIGFLVYALATETLFAFAY